MESLVYRVISMGARFACPLIVLYLSTPATMGKYYLFTTYFTFIVFLIALELGVPFSARYLRAEGDAARRRVFSRFVITQLTLSVLLAVPATAIYYISTPATPLLMLLFALAIISETCVNETGRFFWNIGEVRVASRRDLIRSLAFVSAVLAAVVVEHEVVSYLSLGFISVCNSLILARETKVWGRRQLLRGGRCRTTWQSIPLMFWRTRSMVVESLPQVMHIQLLALMPLLERTLIGRWASLEMVAGYSFQYSVIQTGASLFLLPVVAEVRRNILAAVDPSAVSLAGRASLKLLLKILLVAGLLVVFTHFLTPLVGLLSGKYVPTDSSILMAAYASACAATFASAVSPLYACRSRLLVANIATMSCLIPLVIGLLFAPSLPAYGGSLVMVLIMLAAGAQLMIRVAFLMRRS